MAKENKKKRGVFAMLPDGTERTTLSPKPIAGSAFLKGADGAEIRYAPTPSGNQTYTVTRNGVTETKDLTIPKGSARVTTESGVDIRFAPNSSGKSQYTRTEGGVTQDIPDRFARQAADNTNTLIGQQEVVARQAEAMRNIQPVYRTGTQNSAISTLLSMQAKLNLSTSPFGQSPDSIIPRDRQVVSLPATDAQPGQQVVPQATQSPAQPIQSPQQAIAAANVPEAPAAALAKPAAFTIKTSSDAIRAVNAVRATRNPGAARALWDSVKDNKEIIAGNYDLRVIKTTLDMNPGANVDTLLAQVFSVPETVPQALKTIGGYVNGLKGSSNPAAVRALWDKVKGNKAIVDSIPELKKVAVGLTFDPNADVNTLLANAFKLSKAPKKAVSTEVKSIQGQADALKDANSLEGARNLWDKYGDNQDIVKHVPQLQFVRNRLLANPKADINDALSDAFKVGKLVDKALSGKLMDVRNLAEALKGTHGLDEAVALYEKNKDNKDIIKNVPALRKIANRMAFGKTANLNDVVGDAFNIKASVKSITPTEAKYFASDYIKGVLYDTDYGKEVRDVNNSSIEELRAAANKRELPYDSIYAYRKFFTRGTSYEKAKQKSLVDRWKFYHKLMKAAGWKEKGIRRNWETAMLLRKPDTQNRWNSKGGRPYSKPRALRESVTVDDQNSPTPQATTVHDTPKDVSELKEGLTYRGADGVSMFTVRNGKLFKVDR